MGSLAGKHSSTLAGAAYGTGLGPLAGWGFSAGVALAVVAGLASAWLMPRGPITSVHALWSLALAALVGAGAGYLSGNRWTVLTVPTVYLLVFELARLRVEGPTVDGVHLGSGLYGVIAFVLGRVFPALLTLVPLAVGTVFGIALTNRLDNGSARPLSAPWLILSGVTMLALALLAFVIARPARTAPIIGVEGQPVANGIAELLYVPIGGHDQALMIRGRDSDNPVLLYLTGGPGGTDIGAMRRDVTLEQDFTVVTWDQRGAGKSYAAIDPIGTLTLAQMVSDTVELTDYLRQRFGQEKIFLVGQSWGSTLGVLTVQQHPERYHAFVGVGQMVSQRATDVMFWEDALAWAERTGDTRLAARLRRNGSPPYTDMLAYDPVVAHEHSWNAYPGFDGSNEMPGILMVPEYTFLDRINAFRGFLDSAATLYPQLQGLDFRVDAARLEVPITMVLGEHEARGRAVLAEEWFALLDAPDKRSVVFEGAGHRANFDFPDRFAHVMREVLDAALITPLDLPYSSDP